MSNKTSINTLILSDIHLGLRTSRPTEAIKNYILILRLKIKIIKINTFSVLIDDLVK